VAVCEGSTTDLGGTEELAIAAFCTLALTTKDLAVQCTLRITLIVPRAPDSALAVDYATPGTTVDFSAHISNAICGCDGRHWQYHHKQYDAVVKA